MNDLTPRSPPLERESLPSGAPIKIQKTLLRICRQVGGLTPIVMRRAEKHAAESFRLTYAIDGWEHDAPPAMTQQEATP